MNPFDVTHFVSTAGLIGMLVLLFMETGLLIGFVFPGDSLLFTAGIFAAQPDPPFHLWTLCVLLPLACIAGDQCGYVIGKFGGHKALDSRVMRWIGDDSVDRTHRFFERYGPATVLFARFIAVVRTLSPLLAGLSEMRWGVYTVFSVLGCFAWAGGVSALGYALGGVPVIRDHIDLILIGAVSVVLVPMVIGIVVRARRVRREDAAKSA